MPIDIGPNGSASDDRPEVELLASGKVRITIEVEDTETGTATPRVWMLKRPKIGQMKRLRELLYEQQDSNHARTIEEARQRAQEAVDAAKAEEASPDASPAEKLEARLQNLEQNYEANRKSRARGEELEISYLGWTKAAVGMLSGQSLDIDDDDLPFILATGEFVTALQHYWRTVPFGSGQSVA